MVKSITKPSEDSSIIGIDVSKKLLDVHVHPNNLAKSFSNDKPGMEQLIVFLKDYVIGSVVVEATGGLEMMVLIALHGHHYKVCRINPRWMKDFAKAKGKLVKTDQSDAKLIALYGEKMEPEAFFPPDSAELGLQEMLSRRKQLLAMITMENNRLQQRQDSLVYQLQYDCLIFLKAQLKEVEASLDAMIAANEKWLRKREIIESIPGVGPATAKTLIAELPELGQLTGKQISALVGVAPYNKDSGSHAGYRRISGGRGHIRQALYMTALAAATKFNSRLMAFYQKFVAQGKSKKVALVAVMHKLIIMLNAMIRDNKLWEENKIIKAAV